jgi:hypothetical protein
MLSNVKVFERVPQSTQNVRPQSYLDYDFDIEHYSLEDLRRELASRGLSVMSIWIVRGGTHEINNEADYRMIDKHTKICVLHRTANAAVGAEFHKMGNMYEIMNNLHIRLSHLNLA